MSATCFPGSLSLLGRLDGRQPVPPSVVLQHLLKTSKGTGKIVFVGSWLREFHASGLVHVGATFVQLVCEGTDQAIVDEPQKTGENGVVEKHFGIATADRRLKFPLDC